MQRDILLLTEMIDAAEQAQHLVIDVSVSQLDDPHTCRRDVPGQASAIAAGALDANQAHRPEPGQPLQQEGIASRGNSELPDAE